MRLLAGLPDVDVRIVSDPTLREHERAVFEDAGD
jgi:hypothetical protein